MAEKQVKVKVATEADLKGVTSLENKIEELRRKRIRFELETDTRKLEETRAKIKELENKKATLNVDANDAEIKKIDAEIEALKFEEIDLDLKVRQNELKEAEAKIDSMDPSEIDVNVNNISAMEAVSQIGEGFDRLKQGASEVGQVMGDVLDSAGRMEQTETFLSMNLGADVAKKKLEEIRSVTDKLPGDDVTLQNLLSQAALKDANMTTEAFTQMGGAAADYMAAMQNFGKSATETQQDLMNYILAGNTAEIERSPILQSHVDKLKEATTVQERSKALQEALTEEGWNGIASQDIYNNKLQQFNDMIERGKMNFGDMFLKSSEGAMDFIMKLDEASGGLVGMTIAVSQMATPITDVVMGLGQIATGLNALKDAGDLLGITSKLGGLKNALFGLAEGVKSKAVYAFNSLAQSVRTNVLPALKSAITGMASFAKELIVTTAGAVKNAVVGLGQLAKGVLLTGYNALKSAVMWVAEKAALVASTIAEYAATAAQWALNIAMDANPIGILIIAITALIAILAYLYFNNEQVRAAIDGLGQSLMMVGQLIWTTIVNAVQGLITWLQNLWNTVITTATNIWTTVVNTVTNVIAGILRVIIFIQTLPIRIATVFANVISRVLSFAGNFVSQMVNGASNAVSGFISYIQQLPGIVMGEFERVLGLVNDFINSLPDRVWEMGQAIIDALKRSLGIGSPGYMYYMFEGELERLDNLPGQMGGSISRNISSMGRRMVDAFDDNSFTMDIEGNGSFTNGSIQELVTSLGNTGDITVIVNGDVDNENRIQQIVDAVRREINWNNKTAGRSKGV